MSNRCSYSKTIFRFGGDCADNIKEEMDDTIKIVKYLEESSLLNKAVVVKIENEIKEQKRGFLGMLATIPGATLLANMLTGRLVIRAGEGTGRAGQDF